MGFEFETECSVCYLQGRGEVYSEHNGLLCVDCIKNSLDDGEVLRHRFLSGITRSGPGSDGAASQEACYHCRKTCFLLFSVKMCDSCDRRPTAEELKKMKEDEEKKIKYYMTEDGFVVREDELEECYKSTAERCTKDGVVISDSEDEEDEGEEEEQQEEETTETQQDEKSTESEHEHIDDHRFRL